jgi:hypothetical protein
MLNLLFLFNAETDAWTTKSSGSPASTGTKTPFRRSLAVLGAFGPEPRA